MAGVISLIRAVGIPWYRQEDWSALLAIFEDGDVFDSFEQWEERATEVERDHHAGGRSPDVCAARSDQENPHRT